jgi:hypothetical protein
VKISGSNPKKLACQENRGSFDYGSRDKTARASAQDDIFYIDQ